MECGQITIANHHPGDHSIGYDHPAFPPCRVNYFCLNTKWTRLLDAATVSSISHLRSLSLFCTFVSSHSQCLDDAWGPAMKNRSGPGLSSLLEEDATMQTIMELPSQFDPPKRHLEPGILNKTSAASKSATATMYVPPDSLASLVG